MEQITPEMKTVSAPKKKSGKMLPVFLVFFVICIVACLSVLIILQKNSRVAQASQLALQGRCPEAIQLLDEIIAEDPKSVKAYQVRVECYLSFQSNVFTEAQGNLVAALQDTNTILELQPQDAGYYAKRDYILRELANLEVYSVNKFAIYDLANRDVDKSIELGAPASSYVYRHRARNLIEGYHCQEGLEETQKLIQQYGTQTADYGQYYSLYLTEAYICLGDLDKALESAQFITCDDPVSTCRSGLLTEIYLQSGDYDNALTTVNYMINWQPVGGGWRYFIRAMIYYEQGLIEPAMQELETGSAYSWYGNGVYWYVNAQMAFDSGDEKTGIDFLHQAEQTLDVGYAPLRRQIIKELASHGEKPMELEPNLPFEFPSLP